MVSGWQARFCRTHLETAASSSNYAWDITQTYLEATKDSDGNWLDGGKTYRLRVDAHVPAKQFWSVTAYDNESRCFIDNSEEIADRSSRMDLIKNADGSTDIFFGLAGVNYPGRPATTILAGGGGGIY